MLTPQNFRLQSLELHWTPAINTNMNLFWSRSPLSSNHLHLALEQPGVNESERRAEDEDETWLRSSGLRSPDDEKSSSKPSKAVTPSRSIARLKRSRVTQSVATLSQQKPNLIKPVIQKTPLRRRDPSVPFRLDIGDVDENDEFSKRALQIASSILPFDMEEVSTGSKETLDAPPSFANAYTTFIMADRLNALPLSEMTRESSPSAALTSNSSLTPEMKAAIERKRQIALALLKQKQAVSSPLTLVPPASINASPLVHSVNTVASPTPLRNQETSFMKTTKPLSINSPFPTLTPKRFKGSPTPAVPSQFQTPLSLRTPNVERPSDSQINGVK